MSESEKKLDLDIESRTLQVLGDSSTSMAGAQSPALALDRQLHRTFSLRREVVPVSARIPVEFRTISIHVDNVQRRRTQETGIGKHDASVKEITALDWHKITVDETLLRLSVAPKSGLDIAQVHRRLAAHGRNVISPPPNRLFRRILGWFFGGFGTLLLAASVICFVAWKPLGNPNPQASNLALAVVLLIVVFLQAAFNAWQDFSTSRVMASISGMLPTAVQVLRDTKQQTVPASELVNGDIVYIAMGMKVPADLRLIQASGDLKFDRSILTGESKPIAGRVERTDDNFLETKNIALQGTLCIGGSGIGVVIQTGDTTVFGRIAKLSSQDSGGLTTLQREILRFVLIIAGLALLIAIMIVIVWAAWLKRSYSSFINTPTLLIDIVSVMVAFIPEGLPVAVTMSLAKVAHTLGKHKVLCKSLSIVETLGAVNVLCSDKTGTLTQNKMRVEDVAIYDLKLTPAELIKKLHDLNSTSNPDLVAQRGNVRQLASVAAICNAAVISYGEKGVSNVFGDATDSAILSFADSVEPADEVRAMWDEVYKVSFNSKTKYMLRLCRLSPKLSHLQSVSYPAPIAAWDNFDPSSFLLTIKGAPEVLLPRCNFVVSSGSMGPQLLTPDVRARVVEVQEQWAAQGRRVLLLARKILPASDIPASLDKESEEFAEIVDKLCNDLIIVGLVGLIDPLKPDIPHTVRICRDAGIRFFVVTGDHPTTSVAIAAQAGIISNVRTVAKFSDLDPNMDISMIPKYDPTANPDAAPRSIVITGPEFAEITPSQMEQLAQFDEIVFARTSPEQKLKIVREFRSRENIVAMTGDGVNDAPSLKAADVGIAMGNGSDVAREAADMILLEDFSAIVTALEYGRLVYDNLKKTILYLLPAGSFSELMPILLNVLLGLPQVLSNLQMIIICVGTDVFPALSLSLERPEMGLLQRKPRNVKKDHMVDWKLLLHAYFFIGILESLCANAMAFWYLQRKGVHFSDLVLGFGNWPTLTNEDLFKAQSVYFFTLVIMQWGNLFATRCRKLSIFRHSPLKNPYLFLAIGCALAIGIFFSYIPWFQNVFQTRGIPVEYFFLPIAFGIGLLFVDETRKYFVRHYPKSFIARIAW